MDVSSHINLPIEALTFITRHAGEHLDDDDLVRRTANHLCEVGDISADTAFQIASLAWAEYNSSGDNEWIDVSRTTSRCVLLHLEDGATVAFTAHHLNQAAALLRANGICLPGYCPT